MEKVFDKTAGFRTIMGTDWPISVVVYKNGAREWRVARICNGIAESSRIEKTKRDAIAIAEQWVSEAGAAL